MRLDNRDKLPSGFEEYLSIYGWHFSKKLCMWAVSNMKKDDGKRIMIMFLLPIWLKQTI